MSHFQFIIPHNKEELLESESSQYRVENVYSVEDIEHGIDEISQELQENGSEFILDHFDMLYSMLVHFNDVDWSLVHITYNSVILKSLNELISRLKNVLDTAMDLEVRIKHLNILKMILYIFCQFTNAIQDRILLENSTAFPDKKGKKVTKQKSKADDISLTWDEKQRTSFNIFEKILNFHLNKLWEPPLADEGFVNMCANCCYKALENPSISYVKSKPLRDTIFSIIGVLIKQYNHGSNFIIKIVQLLSLYEHLVTPFAQAVVTFVQDLGCKSLVSNILQELMGATENSQDNNSIKSFSSFLAEIAGLDSEIMLPSTKELIRYLEKDQYTMRNCVLTIITTVLLSHFSKDDMDEDSKEQRDIYLDLLEEHMLDGNAFVRSKVIQLWQKVIQQNALPKSRTVTLLEMTMKRLQDKSSVVCKGAIQLLRVILESNPFGPRFHVQELTLQLLGEVTRLEEMRKLSPSKKLSREDLWDIVEPELSAFLLVTFVKTTEKEDNGIPEKEGNLDEKKSSPEDAEIREEISDKPKDGEECENGDNLSSKLNIISNLIKREEFEKSLALLKVIVEQNSEAPELKVDVEKQPEAAYFSALMRKIFFLYGDKQSEQMPVEPQKAQVSVSERDLEIQEKVVEYLTDTVEFVKGIDRALEEVTDILQTRPVSEVLEAIEMLTVAYQFGIPKAHQMVPVMLDLVFSKEPGVKEAVTAAYNTLYITVDTMDRRVRAEKIAKKLRSLVRTLNYGQYEALAQLVIEWIKSGHIDDEFIKVLLEDVRKCNSTLNENLILLEMIGRAKAKVIADNLPLLIKKGLYFAINNNPKNNFLRTAFFASRGIHNLTLLKSPSGQYPRYPSDHKLIETVLAVIKKPFLSPRINDIDFITVASQNINLLFELSTDPINECEKLIVEVKCLLKTSLLESQKASGTVSQAGKENSASEVNEANEEKRESSKTASCNVSFLTRYIFIIGHIAFKLVFYLEDHHLETLKKKYREEVKVKAASKQDQKKKNLKKTEEDEDSYRYEMDALAAADDRATEEVHYMLETQILSSNQVIGKCCSSVINICRNPTRYNNPLLKCVAAMSLGKLMLVSSVCCKDNLQLLATLLEKSTEESVRVAIIMAFGDLLFRFPNVVAPWTRHLYNRLKDDSHAVRMTTLLVIYFLVSNEMVKIKGQISLVALCIIDKHKEISDVAHQFFIEIAQKGNTLYNVMPDIISNLSNPDAEESLSEENFQVILKFLISQIQKERQLESLVEKICNRIQTSRSERQWYDLTYCLSLLQWSDRSLKKLLDLAGCYADKLSSPPVAELFQQIASNVIKSTRPGLKEIGMEFNNLIEEVLKKGLDLNDENALNVFKTPSKGLRRPSSKTPATHKKTRAAKKTLFKKIEENSEESSDSSDDVPQRRTNRKPKKRSKTDEDSSSSAEEVPQRRTNRKPKKRSKSDEDSSSSAEEATKNHTSKKTRSVKKSVSSSDEESNSSSDNDFFKPSNSRRQKVERALFQ